MKVALGSDHAGFLMKKDLIDFVGASACEPIDLGTYGLDSVDYPDFAAAVARAVQAGEAERGIILCGSGVGACIVANKVRGVRAAVCHDTYSAHQGVEHDDMNVLCLGARVIGIELARELVRTFLNAAFTNEERHARRLEKVARIEQGQNS